MAGSRLADLCVTKLITATLVTATWGCQPRPPTVAVRGSCVPEFGYACDWDAGLRRAVELQGAKQPCEPELAEHWSEEVRRVCQGETPDERLRFGICDFHFPDSDGMSVFVGAKPVERPLQLEKLRDFRFPGVSSEHAVSAVVETRLGVLVGVDAGEWGGGLVWLPRHGEPRLLFRAPVFWIFEHGARVYVISYDWIWRGQIFEIDRIGPDRAAQWTIESRFLLPGRVLELWQRGVDVIVDTDAGVVVIDGDGNFHVAARTTGERIQ